jgi:hypothetical protein
MIFQHGIYAGLEVTPTGITYPLPSANLMFDIDFHKGVTVNGNGEIIGVQEQSGNGILISQFAGNAQLIENAINGYAAADINPGAFVTESCNIGRRTYYAVIQMIGLNPAGFSSLIYQDGGAYCQLYLHNNGDVALYIGGSGYSSGMTWTAGTPMVIKAEVGETQNRITINGVAGVLNTHNAFPNITLPFNIGVAGSTANMYIGRLATYTDVIIGDNDTAAQAALKQQFGIIY